MKTNKQQKAESLRKNTRNTESGLMLFQWTEGFGYSEQSWQLISDHKRSANKRTIKNSRKGQ